MNDKHFMLPSYHFHLLCHHPFEISNLYLFNCNLLNSFLIDSHFDRLNWIFSMIDFECLLLSLKYVRFLIPNFLLHLNLFLIFHQYFFHFSIYNFLKGLICFEIHSHLHNFNYFWFSDFYFSQYAYNSFKV